MTYERDFKGVWIPKEIWLDEEIGWTEKLLLVEIESLCKAKGCFASNQHFAEFFSLSAGRVSKIVSSLRDKGYITVELTYKEGTKQVDKRIIKMTRGYVLKRLEGIDENDHTPIVENSQGNNTSFNNTINNTKDIMLDKPSVTELDVELELEFDYFYKMYPKKVERKRALPLYKKARKKYSEEHIINGLLNYIDWIKLNGTENKYIKGPAVYLNGENFNDEYDFSSIKQNKNKSWGEILNDRRANGSDSRRDIHTLPELLG